MIVAVTGGTGFIGSRLVRYLAERGDTVRLLTRRPAAATSFLPSVEPHECDLTRAGVRELASVLDGVEVLFHCAGQLTDTVTMRELHVDATRKLAEAASRRIAHWVQLSSVGVYGPVSAGSVTEDTPLNPVGDYEITKAESDRIVVEATKGGAFSYSILRPSNVFAADMKNQSLFGMARMIDKGLFFFVGEAGASANYIHVDCVVEALVRCATIPAAKSGIYNLSDYRTLEQFVGTIAAGLGRPAPWLRLPAAPMRWAGKLFGRIPGFPLTESRVTALVNRSAYPISHIQQELGYVHPVSMEEGLRQLVAAYRQGQ